ncbi:MAG: thiamine phosphate synthase [Hyphomicrobiaceae bacterium]
MSETVQLMVVAPCHSDTIGPLTTALDRVAIACVLITPPAWQPGTPISDDAGLTDPASLDEKVCRSLVDLVQSRETAALVANDAAMAAETGADGCHLDPRPGLEDTYGNTRTFLGNDAIIGTMPDTTRHMAMSLAEAGADYVGYIVHGADDADGLGLIAWWAEIFESPVVAFTNGDIDSCRRAIEVGPPDFLSCPLRVDDAIEHLQGVAQLIDDIGQLPVATKDSK